jgi:thiol-disulfide isomerase/thioredoxin
MITLLVLAQLAWASSLDVVERCLALNDLPCAEGALEAMGARESAAPEVLAAVAEVDFYAGRYPEAYDTLERAVAGGWVDRWSNLALYRRTLHATAGWVEHDRGRFAVRYRPGLDAVLLDDAFRAVQLAEEHIAPLIGDPPPGTTILEIFPDSTTFTAASSLMLEDVQTTGVIALSKWSRLLVTSPRARGRGYDWQDTIAHEYIHLVVSHNSGERAPVWLQEAIAKYLDNRWETGDDGFRLDPRSETYLAEALRRDQLVSFEEMHPSLAKLETVEKAALAYAQLSTLMAYCFEIGGEGVVRATLEAVTKGSDPRDALASAAGVDSFPELLEGWRSWVEQLHLEESEAEELPVVLDGGGDLDLDPVLARRRDLGRFVLLGDLLREHGESEAALVEYDKARDPDEPDSPLVANRVAAALLELGRPNDALRALDGTLAAYPEFPLTHRTLGDIHRRASRAREARDAYVTATALNPFDVSLQSAIGELSRALGDSGEAERREAMVRLLRRGGEDTPPPPLHERSGDYTPPTYPETSTERATDPAAQWRGESAPPLDAVDMQGGILRLEPGVVTVVDFWATWCGPCVKAIPELAALHRELGSQGVRVVGISDERAEIVRKFLGRHDVPYVIGLDRAGRTRARYEVVALPTVFVVGRDGRVVDVVSGAGNGPAERIREAVQKALGGG